MRDAREGNTPAKSWDNAVTDLTKRAETAVIKGEQAVTDAATALNNANAAVNICKSATDAANTATSKGKRRDKERHRCRFCCKHSQDERRHRDRCGDCPATNAANASKDGADLAAADARKAAEEARGSVSSYMKIYFKRVTDAQGNSWPVLVDMTI